MQRGASHGVELLGILAFHASPVWVLAALADAAGGSRTLVREISCALKEEGLLEPDAGFDTIEQVLDGLEKTSDHLGHHAQSAAGQCPGIAAGMGAVEGGAARDSAEEPPGDGRRSRACGSGCSESARKQERTVFAVSSLMAVSAVAHLPANVVWLSRAARSAARRTGKVLGETILDHYTEALNEMSRTGFAGVLERRSFART